MRSEDTLVTADGPPHREINRLIEWTGERCVPWADDIQMVYEHLHRYHFASRFVTGKRVVDLGCGEGYGTAILAASAAHVLGVDVDQQTIDHCRINYSLPNVEFLRASVTDLAGMAEASVDVAVCFEVIEHTTEQGSLLEEAARVLRQDGLLIVSTPDRHVYSEARNYHNPFHEKELDQEELVALLRQTFSHVALWGQSVTSGSLMLPLLAGGKEAAAEAIEVRRDGESWRREDARPPTYTVALASRASLPASPGISTLADFNLEIVRHEAAQRQVVADELTEVRRELQTAQQMAKARRQRARVESQRHLDALVRPLAADVVRIAVLLPGSQTWKLVDGIKRLRRPWRRGDVIGAAATLYDQATELQRRASTGESSLGIEGAAGDLLGTIARVKGLKSYRVARSLQTMVHVARLAPDRAGVIDTMERTVFELVRATQAVQYAFDREFGTEATLEPHSHPLWFPEFAEPIASIIVPVHNQALYTFTCLKAILLTSGEIPYEVIVVDDESSDDTASVLSMVRGIQVLRNATNQGFLQSCRIGADAAKGRYLVFLNNDTIPRDGWLEEMMSTFDSHADAGLIGAKLLNPDGSLQEAGGILWQDGSAWNYGRGSDPERPEFNYVRTADYCSGACIAIPRDLYFAVGGFDPRYAPAYYEDVDLALAVKNAGRSVLYQPAAQVIHFDGISQGQTNAKRHMEPNREVLLEKWGSLIARNRPNGMDPVREKDRDAKAHILVIDHLVPTPDHDAGSARMFAIVSILSEMGYKVTFGPDDLRRHEPYTRRLQDLGVEVLYAPQVPDLARYIEQTAGLFDIALLSRVHVAPKYVDVIHRSSPATKMFFDTVDLVSVRTQRLAELTGAAADRLAAQSLLNQEMDVSHRVDLTIVVSEAERDTMLARDPSLKVAIVPTVYSIEESVIPFEQRSGLIFIGGFDHPPNADAVLWFAREIFPLVLEAVDDAIFFVVGSRPPAEVENLQSDHIRVTGHVQDAKQYFEQCRVSVAPLRYGAGVKGKINHSMSLGTPVVATSIAIEGMHLFDGDNVLVADKPADFAQAVVKLYTDPELWQVLSTNGLDNIRRHFSPEATRSKLELLLANYQPASGRAGRSQIV